VTHIGDTRAYRLRGDLLERLTVDHGASVLSNAHGKRTGQTGSGRNDAFSILSRG